MSYIIKQKIGKYVYVYEAESYWDCDKQQPRQRRRYLGKAEPKTGRVIPPQKISKPSCCRDFGNVYLLTKIAEEIGLVVVLKESFPDNWNEILACAFFEVSECRPLYLCKSWLELSYVENTKELTSQRISELLKDIGKRFEDRLKFFKLWAKQRRDTKSIVFDITSLSSYSKLIKSVEWGYNRNGESLPQLNFGVIFGEPSALPLFYNIYPGSLSDVLTLKNIFKFIDGLGLKKVVFILDRGFFSDYNLRQIFKEGMRFVIPLPFTTKFALDLVKRAGEGMNIPTNAFRFNDRVLYCLRDRVVIGGGFCNTYLYLDEKRRVEEVERFLKKVMELEEKVARSKFRDKREVEDFLSENFTSWNRFLVVGRRRGGFVLLRKESGLSDITARMGKMILLNNYEADGKEILYWYRRKDIIEKFFDNMKNEIDLRRLRVHSKEVLEGRLFLGFISLILYSAISKVMKERGLYEDYTMQELIYELKKIKVLELKAGEIIITEVSKKQRDLYKKFEIGIPKAT